ncbi:acylamino-acid-releasing enzyme-like [Sitophilus oryzae]|uniref:Prolyl endopeptidase n=1 Tax=Sitophilus oryzae TaxID=7048 RepID=A0A6J2XHC1_SITOR|nr:acylamino-acid-releasing enzyme-like [Sitophilus oryzae]
MSFEIDKLVKTYKSLSRVSALTTGQIQSQNIISTTWSQRNIEKGKTARFSSTILLNNNFEKIGEISPFDITTESLSQIAKSGNLKAVIRENDSKQYLEIWQSNSLIRVVDLTSLDMHGSVYTDAEFRAFEFSPDEKKLIYVAEKKNPKSEPFYKRKKSDGNGDNNDGGTAKPTTKGDEYLFEQDWGEQLVGKKRSIVVQYDIEKDTAQILEGIPENVCVAKTKYSPDGSYIVGVAYFTEPRKLGLIYCSNRRSTIFQLDFEGHYYELNLKDNSVNSPIFTPDGNSLVWLQRRAGGPHKTCMALVKTSVPLNDKSKVEIIVDIVAKEKIINNNKLFYGIYNTAFPKRPWASNNRLLLNTYQKYTINSYVIDIDTGAITELEWPNGSQIIVDTYNDVVLAVRRNFLIPDILVIGTLTPDNLVDWVEISPKVEVDLLKDLTYKYLDIVVPEESVSDFNAIYIGPKNGEDATVPLVIVPHGGPNSAFTNCFMFEVAIFLALGYAVLLINYRGSIGAGNDSIYYLAGKVGTADVQDCILAVDTALKEFPWINPEQLALRGGSYGGFLVTHLSGQYPDKFKVVVARNPVIDIASKSISSDIPDLCYVGVGESYSQVGEPNTDHLLKMRNATPIMHAHKVTAPTLLLIGSKDLRVPPSQSLEYYTRLKSNNIKVRMNLYEDSHPLGSVPNEMDSILNTIIWIDDHLKHNK